MNVYLPNGRLPSAYQEVEYIESSGTQYISTGYIPTIYDAVEIKFKTQASTSDTNLYGSRYVSGGNYQDFTIWINTSSGKGIAVHYPYGGGVSEYRDTGWFFASDIINTPRILKVTPNNCSVDGSIKYTFTDTRTAYTGTYNAYLFGRNQGGSASNIGKFTIYYCKIYNNGVLQRYMIPCYRKSDSVIGMYDLVNNQFYTNSGTGTFSKGNDVVMAELKNAYIGKYREWTPNDHTLLYLPLESDVVDKSGKTGRIFTTSGISYTTVGGVPSVHVGTTGGAYLTAPKPIVTPSVSKQTISILTYVTSQQTSDRRNILEWRVQNNVGTVLAFEGGTTEIRAFGDSVGDTVSANIIANQRMHIVLTNCSEGKKLYLNGQLVSTGAGVSSPRGSWAYSYQQSQGIFCRRGDDYGLSMNGNARELIAEDTIWSAEDVSNYYQRIKAKLGF